MGEHTKIEDVQRLVKWKILKRDKNNLCIFTMKKGDHNKLKRILGLHEHSLRWCLFVDDILWGLRIAGINQLKQYHFRNTLQMAARYWHYCQSFKGQYVYPCREETEWRVMVVMMSCLALIAFILATIVYFTYAPTIQLVGYIIYTWVSTVYGIVYSIVDAGVFLFILAYQCICMTVECILSIPFTVVVGVLCGLAGFVSGFVWGQHNPTLTLNGLVSIISNDISYVGENTTKKLKAIATSFSGISIEQLIWESCLTIKGSVEFILGLILSLFVFLARQIAYIWDKIEDSLNR